MRLEPYDTQHQDWLERVLGDRVSDLTADWQACAQIANGDNAILILTHKMRRLAGLFCVLHRPECDLISVIVAADERRQGHGTCAVRYLERELRKGAYKNMHAFVRSNDDAGQLFFRSLGFVCRDPRKRGGKQTIDGREYYCFDRAVAPLLGAVTGKR